MIDEELGAVIEDVYSLIKYDYEDVRLIDDWEIEARRELSKFARHHKSVLPAAKRISRTVWHRIRSFCVRKNYH